MGRLQAMITIVTVISRMMMMVEVRGIGCADSMPAIATRSNVLQSFKTVLGQGMAMELKIKIFSVVSKVHERFRWAIRTIWAIPA